MIRAAKLSVERIKGPDLGKGLRQEIDLFIERNMGTIFHETKINQISASTFGTDLSYFIARKQGKLVGICPCHSVKNGKLVNSFSNLTSQDLVYGGWVYEGAGASLDELYEKTKVGWNEALHVSSNIELDPAKPCRPSYAKSFTEAHTVVIKLADSSEDDLFQGFKHSQKNKIRKAEKLGVRIVQASPSDIEDFYGLLAELKNSLNMEFSPKEYFKEVFSHYYDGGRGACFLAQHEGHNISTLIVLANKAYATIWFGGRKIGIPNNIYQNELMIWEAIKWARYYGSEYLDLCTVDEVRYQNLARMKLSFSRDVQPYFFFSLKKAPFKILNRIQRHHV